MEWQADEAVAESCGERLARALRQRIARQRARLAVRFTRDAPECRNLRSKTGSRARDGAGPVS